MGVENQATHQRVAVLEQPRGSNHVVLASLHSTRSPLERHEEADVKRSWGIGRG